ncbi:MAG: activator of (R)-2-hydroxyglutaryl-CoA dehydratase [Acidobacteria bacterium]|nr:activator of (R)-2-hydroxyglutaryl-CoA dehydratase [Acidobacteriota bacterium]
MSRQASAPSLIQFRLRHERPFTRAERATTTLLFGGLTARHDRLVQATLEGLGYLALPLPVPQVADYEAGKEFGNNGQCNPTYFTVGNLVRFLQRLERDGMTRAEIEDRFVFFTAGACGPCRFGMYESEYRLALSNAGFEGFRVIVFQQSGGLRQSEQEAGLEMNPTFFLGVLNALCAADVLTAAAFAVRPYEMQSGAVDQWLEQATGQLSQVCRHAAPLPGGGLYRMLMRQLFRADYTRALQTAMAGLDAVAVDRLRVRPVVKITGEFWAQTTEGDGNFRMFSFLEKEGSEVLVEPVATWITYMLHQAVQSLRDRKGLAAGAHLPPWWKPRRLQIEAAHAAVLLRLKLAEFLFRREYHRMAAAMNGLVRPLADQYRLQRLAHPLYHSRAAGGEGHLEVAKNLDVYQRGSAHMVLSLKPFGCMPSTQSDAVQSALAARYPGMIYLPLETSGEGEINAQSRVQMALADAREKALAELAGALQATGLSIDQCRAWLLRHPEAQRPSYRVPARGKLAGRAAQFVWRIARQGRR